MRNPISLLITTICVTIANASITFPHGQALTQEQTEQGIVNPEEITEYSLKGVAHNVANIGLKTLRDLLAHDSNALLSPLNIYTCLGILDLGAVGETRIEIRSVIGSLNENQKINEVLGSRSEVSSASSVFFDHQYLPRIEFINAAMAEFQASILNFNSSHGEEAKNIINGWVRDHTNGTIVDLIKESIAPDTKLVLVSTLLFKAKWLFPFPPESTITDKFMINQTDTVNVEFMRTTQSVNVVKNDLFDAICLPYHDQRGLSMHIVLPKAHGISALKKLLSHFNTNSLKKLKTEAHNENIIILMPKLKLEQRFSLMNSLRSQGIHLAFDPFKANFSGFVDGASDLYVSQMYHSVHFEMDEEGTSASAATAFVVNKRTMFSFRANRPFIFIITDNSDLVLFMGAVVDPR